MTHAKGYHNSLRRWRCFALFLLTVVAGLTSIMTILVIHYDIVLKMNRSDIYPAIPEGTYNTEKEPHIPPVFHDLTTAEIKAIVQYLYATPSFNIEDNINAKPNSSFLYFAELVLPRKSDALDHLDLNYAAPPREAKVVLIRGDKSPPVVEEYVIGPLSNISGHRMTNTMFHKSPTAVPYLFRPVTDVEYREVMKLLKVVDSQLKHVLIESYEASFFNCGDQCLVMKFYTIVSPKSSGQNKRLLWYWAHHDVEPYMLNPVDFAILFNLDGSKSHRYKVEKIWYSGQDFYSAKQLVSYYEVDAMKKSSILFPRTSSKHYFYDSSNFDRFQNLPLRSPKQVMPDRPRFNVKHGHVVYLNWEFYVRMSSQSGPQLFNIKHNNKRLVYELSLQEIASFHSGYNPWVRFSNIIHSSRLLGLHAKHLQPGVDCPYHALFVPSVHLHQSLQHTINNNSFCIFEHSTGYPLRRHSTFTNEFNYKYSGLEDIVLTIRSIITIHNSDYIIDFIFHQNGVIEVKTGISGYPMVTVNSPQEARYGYKVHRNIYSGIEQNMFHFKVDIDVLGIKNRMKTIDITEHSIRNGDWSSDDSSRFQHCAKNQVSIPRKPIWNQQETPGLHAVSP